jgi:DNA-binding CsgD family transcriptional regulator
VTIELDGGHGPAYGPRAFFEVKDADPTAVGSVAEDYDGVKAAHVVTESEEGPARLQVVYDDEPFFGPVTRQGGRLVDAWADDGTGQFRVQLPRGVDVRTSEQLVTDECPGAELIGRQTVEQPMSSPSRISDRVTESLTERQLTVAKTAYYGGYFETPREQTGEELAESLDIASPTFHDHLRSAESKLFESVFD